MPETKKTAFKRSPSPKAPDLLSNQEMQELEQHLLTLPEQERAAARKSLLELLSMDNSAVLQLSKHIGDVAKSMAQAL